MTDNIDVALLTKVNELAVRYGLKPTDFVAVYKPLDRGGELVFEVTAERTEVMAKRFDKMLRAIGFGDGLRLPATDEQLYDRLTDALSRTPKPRGR